MHKRWAGIAWTEANILGFLQPAHPTIYYELNRSTMNIKQICTQVPAIVLLIFSGLTLNLAPAISQSRPTQEIIDNWTDTLFYRANPELSGRKIRADETEYIREWNAIQRIMPDLLVYDNNPCGDTGWILESYDYLSPNEGQGLVSDELNQVADAIFYTRNPELSGRKLGSHETGLAHEWLRIRKAVTQLHPCD